MFTFLATFISYISICLPFDLASLSYIFHSVSFSAVFPSASFAPTTSTSSGDPYAAVALVNGDSPFLPEPVAIDDNGSTYDFQPRVAAYFSVRNDTGEEITDVVNVSFSLSIDDPTGLMNGDTLTAFYYNEATGKKYETNVNFPHLRPEVLGQLPLASWTIYASPFP